MAASNERQNLELLIQTRNLCRQKCAFFEIELVKTNSPGQKFHLKQEIEELEQEIEVYNKKIEYSIQEIEQIERITRDVKSSQKGEQKKTLEIFDYLYQQLHNIPIVYKQIEIIGINRKAEPVVATDWQVNMQLWMQKLAEAKHGQEGLNAGVVDDVMQILLSPNRSPQETRALSSFAMQCLATEIDWKNGTVNFIINKAIDNLYELDGFNNSLNTSMDKSFNSVMQSHFSTLLEKQLLQNYIQTYDKSRSQIAGIYINTKNINNETLNLENATRILSPLLDKLNSFCSLEERVDSLLSLVDIFFRSQINKVDVKRYFLPDVLLGEVIKVLLTAIEQEKTRNYGVSTAALWAMFWLTNAKSSQTYRAYIFSDRELNIFRTVIIDEKHDINARSYAALILSICNSENTIYSQADWIYEWAVVADGGKLQKDLPKASYIERPKDTEAIKKLIISNLPDKIIKNAAISLGRLGCFIPEMVDSLIEIFKDETYLWEQRDEALVYLVFIGNSQVISALIRGVSQPEDDMDKYGFRGRCLLALIGTGNVPVIKYVLDTTHLESDQSACAYALAGVANPLGKRVLESMINHQNDRIRNAVIDALRKFKNIESFKQSFTKAGKSLYSNSSNSLGNYSNLHVDKLIAKQGHFVHKLKAKDSTGRWAYYFVHITPALEQEFLKALESNKSIDLEDYGKVIGSCYGEEPHDKLKAFLKEKYGFDV
ncbi:MAG: hypothetical protein WBA39_24465 [Rivularia sp. (in: cyanobacteria)]